MAKAPTPDNVPASLTVAERMLLFCVASRTDWALAGVCPVTVRALLVKSLIERKHSHAAYHLTDQRRAALSALLADAGLSQ
jgi:hypothetical protein